MLGLPPAFGKFEKSMLGMLGMYLGAGVGIGACGAGAGVGITGD